MKRIIKRIFAVILLCVVVVIGYRFWPYLSAHLFGNSSSNWITQKLEESITSQNELLVLNIETTRIETVTKKAWLIGTVQKVEIPYTFSMHYSVDMSKANVSIDGTDISIVTPVPKPGYQKLVVDESNMKKTDWLFPLTAEGYAEIKSELEAKLFQEYADSQACAKQALENTVDILSKQYKSFVDQLFVNQVNPYRINIRCIDEP